MTTIPTIIGRYEILGRIGQGGMGVLYRAWDPRLDRHVAIKLLLGDNEELRERFAREARSAARLRHPHIVLIFDVGEHGGQPFIAMEYIQGQTLAEIISTRTLLPVLRKLELVEELCDGLAFAHKTGIIHRDIKPANAMVDATGALKILDFGIARIAEASGMTQAGMLIGTLNYMSPEQVMGKEVDNRSDIFAVGSLFYELLAYRQAFPGGLQNGILNKILESQREPIETICHGLDPEVIRILNQALERDPEKRYQDLTVMRKDLQRARARLESATDVTVLAGPADVHPILTEARPATTPSPVRRTAAREEIERRRATQIQTKLDEANRAFVSLDFEVAIALSEEALLLDANEARAIDLHDRARARLDDHQANELLAEADRERGLGALTAARGLIDRAVALSPSLSRAAELRQAIDEELRARESARQRADLVRQAMERAHAKFDAGLFVEAVAAADEALAIDPGLADANAVKLRSGEAILARERQAEQRRVDAERRAKQQRISAELTDARAEIQRQQFSNALGRLHALELAEGSASEIAAAIKEAESGQAVLEQAAKTARQVREHVAQAEVMLAGRELTDALARVDAACALDPSHEPARALRSKVEDAIREAEKLAKVERDQAERRRLEEVERARREIDEALTAGDLDTAERLLNAAEQAGRDKDFLQPLGQRMQKERAAEKARLEQSRRMEREAGARGAEPAVDPGAPTILTRRPAAPAPPAVAVLPPPPVSRIQAPRQVAVAVERTPEVSVSPAPATPALSATPAASKITTGPILYLGAAAALIVVAVVGYSLTGSRSGGTNQSQPTDGASASLAPPPSVAETTTPSPAVALPPVSGPTAAVPPPTAAKPALPADTSAPAGGIEPNVAAFRRRARTELARDARPQALSAAAEGLKLAPSDSELRKILNDMLRDARSRMTVTRTAAAPAGRLAAAASPSAAEAIRLEREAARFEKGGQVEEAIRAMWLAADAFAKAGEEARRTVARPEPPAGSPVASGGQRAAELTPPVTVARAAPAPEVAPPIPAAPPPVAAPADEKPAIARLLRAYEQAYSSLDANGVARVFPGVDRDGLKRGFDAMRTMQVQLQSEQIRVEGTTAAVTGTWVTTARAKVGSSVQQGSASIELRLQKSAAGWIIVSRTMR